MDAQIYTTTDGMALDTISLSREFDRDEDEQRRANRIAESIEKALRGELRLPDMVGKHAAPKGRIRAFALEPSVTINNQWSHRYTMVEVTGLDRTGLLKGELGLDHYEGRSYLGFHHHTALVTCAHAFLTEERLRPRARQPV